MVNLLCGEKICPEKNMIEDFKEVEKAIQSHGQPEYIYYSPGNNYAFLQWNDFLIFHVNSIIAEKLISRYNRVHIDNRLIYMKLFIYEKL